MTALTRRRFVFYLDTALLVVFLVLLSPRSTGLTVHEWLGIALALPLFVHLLLAWSWIATAARRLRPPVKTRDTVNAILNAALFVSAAVVVVSGLVISRVALPLFGVDTIDDRVWRGMHNRWTTIMLLSVSAHIAMNWRWVVTTTRRYLLRSDIRE
jgi:hypothetical protein